ncbi:hypothetical protein BB558_003982 [Smittium angustum]|uniref:Cyclin N-terminal domain-containing protein n=1 Tax=Smittium angustum TaxID=133377 RepID=A0A2U1J4L3_SMIAN|nr:hypothetical protein BB558_003982 [Smittium angustum]
MEILLPSLQKQAEFITRIVFILFSSSPSANLGYSAAFIKFSYSILNSTRVSQSVINLALLYMSRLKKSQKNISPKTGSEFSIITVSLMLASKFLEDNTFTSKTWSKVSSIPLNKLLLMQSEFLEALNYRLYVDPPEYSNWESKLILLQNSSPIQNLSFNTQNFVSPTNSYFNNQPLSSPQANLSNNYSIPQVSLKRSRGYSFSDSTLNSSEFNSSTLKPQVVPSTANFNQNISLPPLFLNNSYNISSSNASNNIDPQNTSYRNIKRTRLYQNPNYNIPYAKQHPNPMHISENNFTNPSSIISSYPHIDQSNSSHKKKLYPTQFNPLPITFYPKSNQQQNSSNPSSFDIFLNSQDLSNTQSHQNLEPTPNQNYNLFNNNSAGIRNNLHPSDNSYISTKNYQNSIAFQPPKSSSQPINVPEIFSCAPSCICRTNTVRPLPRATTNNVYNEMPLPNNYSQSYLLPSSTYQKIPSTNQNIHTNLFSLINFNNIINNDLSKNTLLPIPATANCLQ